MAEIPKLLYIIVLDDYNQINKDSSSDRNEKACSVVTSSFRYTRPVLQSCLQLMGCKARHAFKISRRVFEMIKSANLPGLFPELSACPPIACTGELNDCRLERIGSVAAENSIERSSSVQFELYKRQTTTIVPRETFLDVVCDALSQYKYVGPNQRADLILACRTRERKESVTVLLCGTSGCGKSTLSALLGTRLGVTTVVSTDSIRHMMRSFVDEKQNPLLWASTYHAGECLDPVAVADAKAKRKAKKLAGVSPSVIKDEITDETSNQNIVAQVADAGPVLGLISEKQMAVEGFKAQSEMVIDSLDRLISAWELRKESVVVEGVHLSLNFVINLIKKHPSIIPFMIYITNEEKHMERFAVRAKYMTLDPAKNKYVKYIRNIRIIQDYLCNQADKHLVPKVNNTNVDRSVAVIHATVFSCLRRREAGEQLYDPITNTVPIIDEEYRNQCVAKSSKGMFQVILRKGSSRHLMALLNTDGSVAKAWPVESVDSNGTSKSPNGREKCVGSPLYGPLQIGKAEPVNLQFGSFGISAWPSDTGSTSHTGSVDESRTDCTDTGSRYFSSCCSSPRMLEGASKELKEEISVSGSEEEAMDPRDMSSDDDLTDVDKKEIHDEMEGSVDEESTKTDEEYEDLAMQDGLENGYWSDDDEPYKENKQKQQNTPTDYLVNVDHFLRTSQCPLEPSCPYSTSMTGQSTRVTTGGITKRSLSDSSWFYEHQHSMNNNLAALGEQGSNSTTMYSGPILSGAI